MPSFNDTSLTLLEQVQANQAEAWDRLVDLYAPLVRYWCRRSQLNDEDVAEIFQETFRAVATHIQNFRHERKDDSFRGWLRTITTNKIRDHFRRIDGQAIAEGGSVGQMKIAEISDPLTEDEENSEQDILRASVHQMLEMVRGDFEQRTWEAFWQCQVEGRGTDEIGLELKMTPAAVRKAKYRVLRRMREELDGLID
ncbi:MAG: sigma-70 family RNA polymerase sigma factor [Rubripirellula sp.]|nr:sigma-70 family RNA polymerase sigma factor [Rubripirellula sp.]